MSGSLTELRSPEDQVYGRAVQMRHTTLTEELVVLDYLEANQMNSRECTKNIEEQRQAKAGDVDMPRVSSMEEELQMVVQEGLVRQLHTISSELSHEIGWLVKTMVQQQSGWSPTRPLSKPPLLPTSQTGQDHLTSAPTLSADLPGTSQETESGNVALISHRNDSKMSAKMTIMTAVTPASDPVNHTLAASKVLRSASKVDIEESVPMTPRMSIPSSLCSVEIRAVAGTQSLPTDVSNRAFAKIVLSDKFDFMAGFMVFLSAVFVGVRTDYLVRNPAWTLIEFKVIETLFCMFFVIELTMRLAVFRGLFFTMSGWEWNLLDLVLTVYQVVQDVLEYVLYTKRDHLSADWTLHRPTPMAMYLRFLRFLRLLRLIKIRGMQKYVSEFRVLASSVVHSVRYLIWAAVLLLIAIYVFAVHLTLLVGRHAISYPEDLQPESLLARHWGSLPRSMFSLFQAITNGSDWYNLLTPLMKVSMFTSVIFCSYISLTSLYIMNIITGVFVETAMEAAEEIHENSVVSQLRELFHLEDTDGDGELTRDEFERQLANPRTKSTFKAIHLDVREAENLFTLLDTDGSGCISYDEFVTGCLRLRGHAKSVDLVTLMYECRRTKMLVQAIYEQTQEMPVRCDSRASQSSKGMQQMLK